MCSKFLLTPICLGNSFNVNYNFHLRVRTPSQKFSMVLVHFPAHCLFIMTFGHYPLQAIKSSRRQRSRLCTAHAIDLSWLKSPFAGLRLLLSNCFVTEEDNLFFWKVVSKGQLSGSRTTLMPTIFPLFLRKEQHWVVESDYWIGPIKVNTEKSFKVSNFKVPN